MIILGIDPGSHNTGYAFLEWRNRRIYVLEYGVLRAKTKDPLFSRLQTIVKDLQPLLKQYQPSMLSMENIFFSKNAKSALILGHARGAVLASCANMTIEFREYSPKEVKLAAALKGNASKEQVALMMQQRLNLAEVPQHLDASDALAVAWTALQQHIHG